MNEQVNEAVQNVTANINNPDALLTALKKDFFVKKEVMVGPHADSIGLSILKMSMSNYSEFIDHVKMNQADGLKDNPIAYIGLLLLANSMLLDESSKLKFAMTIMSKADDKVKAIVEIIRSMSMNVNLVDRKELINKHENVSRDILGSFEGIATFYDFILGDKMSKFLTVDCIDNVEKFLEMETEEDKNYCEKVYRISTSLSTVHLNVDVLSCDRHVVAILFIAYINLLKLNQILN